MLSSVTGVDAVEVLWPTLRMVSVAEDGVPRTAPPPGLLRTTLTVGVEARTPAFLIGIVTVWVSWPAAKVRVWLIGV